MNKDVAAQVTDWVCDYRDKGFSWEDMQVEFEGEARRLSNLFFDCIMKPYADTDLDLLIERAKAFQARYGAFVDLWFENARERHDA